MRTLLLLTFDGRRWIGNAEFLETFGEPDLELSTEVSSFIEPIAGLELADVLLLLRNPNIDLPLERDVDCGLFGDPEPDDSTFTPLVCDDNVRAWFVSKAIGGNLSRAISDEADIVFCVSGSGIVSGISGGLTTTAASLVAVNGAAISSGAE